MNDELSFLTAIRANVTEDTTRLVYADWLDEHGEALKAEYLRLLIQVYQLCKDVDPLLQSFIIAQHRARVDELRKQIPSDWIRVVAAAHLDLIDADRASREKLWEQDRAEREKRKQREACVEALVKRQWDAREQAFADQLAAERRDMERKRSELELRNRQALDAEKRRHAEEFKTASSLEDRERVRFEKKLREAEDQCATLSACLVFLLGLVVFLVIGLILALTLGGK